MRYRATHLTRYEYGATVSLCQSELRLVPRDLPWQAVIDRQLRTSPPAAFVDERKDYFGNTVTMVSILEHHDHFETEATSIVEVESRASLMSSPPTTPWEQVRDLVASHPNPETLESFEFCLASPYVPTAPELAALAAPSFTPGRPLVEAARDLTRRIYQEFAYKPTTTAIDTPVLETLRKKRGVCQDFSHVMIGALRSLGLPARYVSGYLRSGASYQGAEASHAWVAVFFPGLGWLDFDPTNDVVPDTNHVTLAWGRDYGDVAPVKGVALGGGRQKVDVAVRVEPLEVVDNPAR